MTSVSLGDVIETVMGQAPPGKECNKEGRGTIFVKAGEFNNRFPVVREWTTKPLKHAKNGDVLVCVVGATAGKVNQAIDCAIGRSVAAVRPKTETLDTGYLYYFLTQQTDELRRKSQGLAQGVITRDMLQKLEIPLPPLEEQKRIAVILDQADALRRLRQRALDKLNTLGQSIFYEMFGDPLTNPNGWPDNGILGDIADISSGITKGRKLNGQKTQKTPYLAVSNVQDRHLNLETVKKIEATEKEISRYRLVRNDLLLTEGGDPDKLGRGTLWKEEIAGCIHQNHIFRVRLLENTMNPVYLNWLVGSERGKQYFFRSAKRTTGIASINMTQLRDFPLLVPPINLQVQFENRIESQEEFHARLLSAHGKNEVLFSSLQQRAFRGEL